MEWLYNNELFELSDRDYYGFVYLITELNTQKKYVGKKFFWSKKTLPPLKGQKRKRRSLVESDWKTYYGSSEKLQEALTKGLHNYKREILHLCKTKGECAYFEAKEQFERNVLLRDDYYNGIISCRINRRSVAHLNG
jgi:hypothetical protein